MDKQFKKPKCTFCDDGQFYRLFTTKKSFDDFEKGIRKMERQRIASNVDELEAWFKRWYSYSWVDKKARSSNEISEVKRILKNRKMKEIFKKAKRDE